MRNRCIPAGLSVQQSRKRTLVLYICRPMQYNCIKTVIQTFHTLTPAQQNKIYSPQDKIYSPQDKIYSPPGHPVSVPHVVEFTWSIISVIYRQSSIGGRLWHPRITSFLLWNNSLYTFCWLAFYFYAYYSFWSVCVRFYILAPNNL